jgi:hypothetical protein
MATHPYAHAHARAHSLSHAHTRTQVAPRPRFDLAELRSCVRAGCVPAPPSGGAGVLPPSSRSSLGELSIAAVAAVDARGSGSTDSARASAAHDRRQRTSVDSGSADSSSRAGCVGGAGSGPAATLCGHSHYGSASLLKMYNERPELLDSCPLPRPGAAVE